MSAYKELAERFPQGLAEVEQLPDEVSGAINAAWHDNELTRRAKP